MGKNAIAGESGETLERIKSDYASAADVYRKSAITDADKIGEIIRSFDPDDCAVICTSETEPEDVLEWQELIGAGMRQCKSSTSMVDESLLDAVGTYTNAMIKKYNK